MALYQLSEFESANGWTCFCSDLLKLPHGGWHYPALVLDISVKEYVYKLQKEYNAKLIPFSKNGRFEWLAVVWARQSDMRKFKNEINAAARKRNFTI